MLGAWYQLYPGCTPVIHRKAVDGDLRRHRRRRDHSEKAERTGLAWCTGAGGVHAGYVRVRARGQRDVLARGREEIRNRRKAHLVWSDRKVGPHPPVVTPHSVDHDRPRYRGAGHHADQRSSDERHRSPWSCFPPSRSTTWGAGVTNPSTPVKETVCDPTGTLTHVSPPAVHDVAVDAGSAYGTAGDDVTRSRPYERRS